MSADSPTARLTCNQCGRPFPDGVRDPAVAALWPTNGYLCDDCAAKDRDLEEKEEEEFLS